MWVIELCHDHYLDVTLCCCVCSAMHYFTRVDDDVLTICGCGVSATVDVTARAPRQDPCAGGTHGGGVCGVHLVSLDRLLAAKGFDRRITCPVKCEVRWKISDLRLILIPLTALNFNYVQPETQFSSYQYLGTHTQHHGINRSMADSSW